MANLPTSCPCNLDIEDLDTIHDLPLYTYTKLPTAPHFRLFGLVAGDPTSPIRGSLSTHTLDEDLTYRALSYAWGTTHTLHPIECNRQKILINCSLYSSLQRLRMLNGADEPIFIDAICINQALEDEWLMERTAQVRQMSRIYGTASQVVADLGEELEHRSEIEELMTFVDTLSHEDLLQMEDYQDLFKESPLPNYSMSVCTTFISIFERPWFRRVWILQEATLAKRMIFLLGHTYLLPAIIWKNAVWALKFWSSSEPSSGTKWNQQRRELAYRFMQKVIFLQRILELVAHTKRINSDLYHSLFMQRTPDTGFVLYNTWIFLARDPRDRLYALMGMVRYASLCALKVDYTEPVTELNRRLSCHLVRTGDLDVLLHSLAWRHTDDHPSWMVRLQDRRPRPALSWLVAELPPSGKAQGVVEADDAVTVKGILMSRIVTRSEPSPISLTYREASPHMTRSIQFEEVSAWWQQAREWFKRLLDWVADHPFYINAGRRTAYERCFLTLTGADRLGMLESFMFSFPMFLIPAFGTNTDKHLFDAPIESGGPGSTSVSHMLSMKERSISVAVLETHHLCRVDEFVRERDVLAAIQGLPISLILRRVERGYRIVSNAYVHRDAYEEMLKEADGQYQEIRLV